MGQRRPRRAQAQTAHYVCKHCGAIWNDADRWAAIEKGEWRATAADTGVAGFHIPGFLSSWLTLEHIVRDFLAAKDDAQLLQVFVNTVLGETWEEKGETVDASGFTGRCEPYTPNSLPEGVRMITAGVDTQGDRLEVQVVGWGTREESWIIEYEIPYGDPAQIQDSGTISTRSTAALPDRGRPRARHPRDVHRYGGHHGNQVYAFAKGKAGRNVFPTKGVAGPRPIWPKRSSAQGAAPVGGRHR